MSKFVDCERDQAFLLPPDLRDWIPEDDLAHFVLEAVERVEMSAFKVNHRGTGSAQYHPRMMLALLIYGYANGIFSSRRIERATYRDIGVRFVAANTMTRSRPFGARTWRRLPRVSCRFCCWRRS
jgi:transposase